MGNRFVLQGWVRIQTFVCLNRGLARSVVARGGHGLQSSFVDRLVAAGTLSVVSFLHSQQCLIDVGDVLRLSLAEPKSDLFIHVHPGSVNAVLRSIVRKLQRGGLIVENVLRVLSQLLQQYIPEMR